MNSEPAEAVLDRNLDQWYQAMQLGNHFVAMSLKHEMLNAIARERAALEARVATAEEKAALAGAFRAEVRHLAEAFWYKVGNTQGQDAIYALKALGELYDKADALSQPAGQS